MGRWYLARHARTAWNSQGRIQGHSESDLDSEGVAQAQRLAKRLASINLHAAYSSDMSRTRATASAILQGRSIPLQATPELRELSYGKWEGMTRHEIRASYPEVYEEYMKGDISFTPPSGESPLQLLARLSPLVERLRAAHRQDEDILLVGHGGTLKGLLVLLMDLPPDLFWRFNALHASLSIVTTYPNTCTLDLWNDTSHLAGAPA